MTESTDQGGTKKLSSTLMPALGEDKMTQDNAATNSVQLPVTLDWYRDSVKWMVGFAALGLAGAAQAYVKVQGMSDEVKFCFVILVFSYTLALIFGTVYYRKLTYFGNQYEYFHKIWEAYASQDEYAGLRGVEPSYPEEAPDFLKPHDPLPGIKEVFFQSAKKRFEDARKGYKPWGYLAVIFLGIATLMTAVALSVGVYGKTSDPNPPQAAVVPHFVMVASSLHRGSDGHPTTHDFLLSETTGEIWQMVCKKGNIVEFVKISVEGLPKAESK